MTSFKIFASKLKSGIKTYFAVAVFLVAGTVCAAESVAELDFTKDFDFKKLFVHGRPITQIDRFEGTDYYTQRKEGEEQFLRIENIIFPVGVKLDTPIEVGDKTAKIVISTEMRQKSHQLIVFSLTITSKELPDRIGRSGPFRENLDSGFGVGGYSADVQSVNRIFWRKEGMDYFYNAQKKPFSFMNKEEKSGEWMEWRLVYNHVEKTLSLFSLGKEEPHLIQRNVDLGGVTLYSLFFGARTSKNWGDFRKVTVKVTEK